MPAGYRSQGCATPPGIQAARQRLQGLRKTGLGWRKVHPSTTGSGCSLRRRGSSETKAPP